MDKQKQIEEMAEILQRVYNAYGEFNAVWLAEHLAVNNIGKIPENAVVLTREELQGIKMREFMHGETCGSAKSLGGYLEQLERNKKRVRKETAEKFAERLKDEVLNFCGTVEENGYFERGKLGFCKAIDEIRKELTEGKV